MDKTLIDLQSSSYPTQPHSIIIANYIMLGDSLHSRHLSTEQCINI